MKNLNKVLFFAVVCLFTFGIISSAHAKNVLVTIDNYPPFHIIPKDGSKPYGEVISVIEAVIKQVNIEGKFDLKLKFTKDTPFKRCLEMIKYGEAELIGGLLDKDDRRKYMHLMKYKPNSNKVFVLRKNWNNDISEFKELKGLRVGIVNGYKYFKEFDKDVTIKKDSAIRLNITLKKLAGNRFDVAICSESEWDSIKVSDPELASKLRLASYKYTKLNPVYFGISKKSWLAEPKYLKIFEKVVKKMNGNHEFVQVIADFYESYTP